MFDDVPDALPTYDAWGELPRVLGRTQALSRGYSRRAIEHRLAIGVALGVFTPTSAEQAADAASEPVIPGLDRGDRRPA
jgi:hypothetical protein